MSVDDADYPSNLTQFRREPQRQTITRKRLASSKLSGIPFYLISLGVIASWTIGVFFGLGFSSLLNHTEKQAVESAAGNRDVDVNLKSGGSPRSPQFAAGELAPIIPPSAENVAGIQKGFSAPAASKKTEASGARTVPQSPHPDAARERHQRRSSAAGTPRRGAPRQAIHDLLRKRVHVLE
jgi:hypothetical protein